MKHARGFTIVEIIVVITAIAILAAITTVTYAGLQVRGRDSERTADVESIASALETYYEKFGTYPSIREVSGTEAGFGMPFLLDTLRIPESALVAPGSSSSTTNSLTTTTNASQNPTTAQYLYYVQNNVGSSVAGGACPDPASWTPAPGYEYCSRFTLKYLSEADNSSVTINSKFGN